VSLAKKTKITGVIIAGVALFAIAGLGFILMKPPSNEQLAPRGVHSSAAENMHTSVQEPSLQGKHAPKMDAKKGTLAIEERLVAEMKKLYGPTISKKSTQVNLLKVKAYLLRLYPKDGAARFYLVLKQAFPDLADEIIKTLEKMERYKSWVEDNAQLLSQMSKLERESLVWEKRKTYLGDDAKEIWSEEILAFEQKKQDVREAIRFLDEADDMTIYEKLDVYQGTLRDAYDGSSEEFVLQNKDLLAKVFLSIQSVQDELKQLSPAQRKMEINNIRREIGFTQQQIEKMEEVDAYRERRWENGLTYMEERETIAGEYEGPELEKQLQALREKYFKHEAKTIAIEEKEGFYRFNRPRIYGRN